jgi:hypothetical protein
MRKVTVDDVLAFNPCPDYPRERLAELWGGREAITCREYAELDCPATDRLWGMVRFWPEAVPDWLDVIVERAIRRSLGKSGCPKWEDWAEKWLSGKERSSSSAADARAAAWAAGDAAWAAGATWAAGDAADAAWAAAAVGRRAAERAAAAARAAARAAGAAWAAGATWADEEKHQLSDFVSIAERIYG